MNKEFTKRKVTKISKPNNKTNSVIKTATRMVLRKPNQEIIAKSRKLKSKRLGNENILPISIQKILSASGYGSRRKTEQLVKDGIVKINGIKAGVGVLVKFKDRVTLKDKQVKLIWPDRLPRIIIYYKQEGELVTRDDPNKRITVYDRLPQLKNKRWNNIGRLDLNTAGLLIFTTSGDLVNQFAHPKYEVDREYRVRVSGILTDSQLKEIKGEGIQLEDGNIFKVIEIAEMDKKTEGKNNWYKIILREGKNREIRRIFEYFGLNVSHLIRVRFGPIAIPPRLKKGQFYELNEVEVDYIVNVMNSNAINIKRKVEKE